MDERRVRVAILDAREIVRAGLSVVIGGTKRIEVVAGFGSSESLGRWRGGLDVVLVEPRACGDAPLASAVAAARDCGARVIALADTAAPPVVEVARAGGAVGLVLLHASGGVIADAVVAASGPTWSFTVWGAPSERPSVADAGLSSVERRILALYAEGMKADSVARAVGLSASTVTTYIHRIRRKYERVGRVAGSRVDLYRLALEDEVLQARESYAVAG